MVMNSASVSPDAVWTVRYSAESAITLPEDTSMGGDLAGLAKDPVELRRFFAKYGHAEDTREAVRLAREFFPTGSRLSLMVETDPEDDANTESLTIDVEFSGEADEALGYYRGFVRKWVAVARPETLGLIGLTFRAV
jgi:hypothetical protein